MDREKYLGVIGIILGAFVSYHMDALKTYSAIPTNVLQFSINLMTIFSVVLFLNIHEITINRYYKFNRWRSPIKVGAFNGWIDNRNKKKKCEKAVFTYQEWKEKLEEISINNHNKFRVFNICLKQNFTKYAIIINPFGEIHLDENIRTLSTLYDKILKYIQEGGIFVSTGGIPFYYVWNEILGISVDTTPEQIELESGRLHQFRPFISTIFTKEFGVNFNGFSSQNLPIFQTQADIDIFGDLHMEGGSHIVDEFRSAFPSNRILPALRTQYPMPTEDGNTEKKEMWPLYVVPYDKGYLMVSGMRLHSVEFSKMVKGIDNFTSYIQSL